ncbi:MAG: nuclear transport factor 2 family protein, partial [Pseudomonadota bacterium]
EMGLQGVFVGKRRVREYLGSLGPNDGKVGGLSDGVLNDHIQLQTVVDVAPDGRTARARAREFTMTGVYQQSGQWSEGTYENSYVKQDGVWKFQSLHFYPTFITDYDKGWGKDAQPVATANPKLPPDRPPTEVYAIYPKAFVPPYHYANPVTGAAPTYPTVGGPSRPLPVAALATSAPRVIRAPRIGNVDAAIALAERNVARVKDYHELENLESAYGYYLDKNLWNNLADLFAKDGSMELAQRGVYKGQKHVREFLFAIFGRGQEGPVEGRLGNHVQMQPVIHVAEDGKTAKLRVRMMQQLSMNSRASMGGAIYENEAVKEDGVWKFSNVHAYNNFTAAYDGGWARAPGRGVPGPSKEMPPDGPPTLVFEMFPNVYDIPYHYANPVTGRTQLPPIRKIKFAQAPPRAAVPTPPVTQAPLPTTPAEIAVVLREIGPRIEAPRTTALFAPLQPKEPYTGVALSRDVAYGPHERNVLDVFTAAGGSAGVAQGKAKGKPVVVFIHGGGFSRGAKHSAGSPFYDNIGLWAASKGLVGVTINYRLAPQFPFPAGVEDLTLVVKWLKSHAAEYGGDPSRIFLWGHSAGGAHAADYIVRTRQPGIAGAILTSGIYALGDKPSVWKDYYGDDPAHYRERESYAGLLRTSVPLLVTYAELDPENFVADSEGLIKGRENAGKPVQHLRVAGHSHISEAYAVGTSDESLSAPVLAFIQKTGAQR